MNSACIPFAQPSPPRLSEALQALRDIEDSKLFTNFGPVNTRFEQSALHTLFDDQGGCLTVCNATTGLMLAIREALGPHPDPVRRYALMPSFTFAAAAQAALWNGLTPLFCDIDPADWSADPASELDLLHRFHDEIAVIVPYATFGYCIDLARYEALQQRYGIPVVVDAAASLGTMSEQGEAFGTGFTGSVVFSMHATKPFSTGEGGLVYSGNVDRIHRLRVMSSFGFGEPRSATVVGLNGKMSEIAALLACLRLNELDKITERRMQLIDCYRDLLPQLTFQPGTGARQAHQFASTLLPQQFASRRTAIQSILSSAGIASATYFSPHVAQQPLFSASPLATPLPVTDDVACRVLSLPLFDTMTDEQVRQVCAAVKAGMLQVS